MPNKKILFLIAGIVVGAVITAVGLVSVYKTFKYIKSPKRYTPEVRFAKENGVAIFTASSLDRIFLDGKTLLKPAFGEKVSLSAARQEYESFQIVLQTERDLSGVSFELSDFIKSDGAKIERKFISWRTVGYVPTVEPYYPVKYVGKWPDPLLPDADKDVPSGVTQPFWVTLYVPQAAAPGDYQASVTVKEQGKVLKTIPVTLRVYDFILPRENHLKTAFDFYGHHTKDRYPQGESESDEAFQARIGDLNEKYISAMLQYRLNPILNIDPLSQWDLGRLDRYRVLGLNNFSIGKRGGTLGNNWPASDDQIENLLGQYRTYGEILKLNRLLPYTYIYTWDEGKIGNPKVAKICTMIHRAYPGLKNMVCYHGFWDPDKLPDWGKDIDIWCFHIDNYIEEAFQKLKKQGIEMWMYISGPSGYGSPNLAMDFDSIDYRIVPWLCWKYEIKGFLYWCVNWWPTVDPFKSARNTKWEQNGNGLLFYPGKNGPLASLRLELFRDGLEDYEYFSLLKEKLEALEPKNLTATHAALYEQAKKLLTVPGPIAASMFEFTKDGEQLKGRRNDIAVSIEALEKILSAPVL